MKCNQSEKLRVFELFRQGYKISEIRSTASRRTLYRWLEEYQQEYQITEIIDNGNNEEFNNIKEDTELNEGIAEISNYLDSGDIGDLVSAFNKRNIIASMQNAVIVNKLHKILNNRLDHHLQGGELSPSLLNCLSNAIKHHSLLEMEYRHHKAYDINVAIQMVESSGYIIQNPAESQSSEENLEESIEDEENLDIES
jgi:hypothetical protein